MEFTVPPPDSPPVTSVSGGSIPGLAGAAAFTLTMREPSPVPVLITVPHGGRAYPPVVTRRLRHPASVALRLEDRYVDRLGEAIAARTGAPLLVAHAPRAMIDLNRAADDVDWTMFARGEGAASDGSVVLQRPGWRARGGLGLIPRRLPGVGELWKHPHERAELHARITGIHAPYHAAIAAMLARLRERWGAALLLDLHSMPKVMLRGGAPSPEIVVGDRFGASCAGALVGATFSWLAANRTVAAHNRPYAGGYVLERHAQPRGEIHALQIEVDRTSYLDSQLADPGEGFAAMVDLLSGLVRVLAADVAAMGRQALARGTGEDWAQAAE